MTGNEKGQKKETPQPLRCGVQKKNSVKKTTHTHQVFHQFLQLDHIAII